MWPEEQREMTSSFFFAVIMGDSWNNTRPPQIFVKEVICWSGGVIHRAHYVIQSQVLAERFILSIFLTLAYNFPSFSPPSPAGLPAAAPLLHMHAHICVIKESFLSSCYEGRIIFVHFHTHGGHCFMRGEKDYLCPCAFIVCAPSAPLTKNLLSSRVPHVFVCVRSLSLWPGEDFQHVLRYNALVNNERDEVFNEGC